MHEATDTVEPVILQRHLKNSEESPKRILLTEIYEKPIGIIVKRTKSSKKQRAESEDSSMELDDDIPEILDDDIPEKLDDDIPAVPFQCEVSFRMPAKCIETGKASTSS